MGFRAGQDFERQGKKAIAGEHGGGFVEPPVGGWLAAPQVVVIHAGQVVVDERVGVQGFDRRRRPRRASGGAAEQASAAQGEEGPQALAAGEHRVAHSLAHTPVRRLGARQELVQGALDDRRGLAHRLLERRWFGRRFGVRGGIAQGHLRQPITSFGRAEGEARSRVITNNGAI